MATPLQTYNTSQEHTNALKWQNATINDVAKKYGFDFSKDYANQQAEVAAQAQRNQYNVASRSNASMNSQTLKSIDTGLKDGLMNTEDSFFQSYLQQRQNQANRGLNAGIQADQDTRLAMNQQKVFAGLYRDANNARSKEMDRFNNEAMTIQQALALVEQKKLADAAKMYQDLLTQGYGLLGQERGWWNTLDQQAYGKYRDQIADAQEAARLAASRASRGPSGGPGGPGSEQALSAQAIIDQYLDQMETDTYTKMNLASPKLDPTATSGIASQPGSYWYARGYGSQYDPYNYQKKKSGRQDLP